MVYEYRRERTVEFADTDMAGIVHFAEYFRFMEATEHAFFHSLGLSLHGEDEEGMYGWVRVHASCDFFAPLKYPQTFVVHLLVAEKAARRMTYCVRFERDGNELARGRLQVVPVRRAPGADRIRSVPIPAEVDRIVEVAPPEVLAKYGSPDDRPRS